LPQPEKTVEVTEQNMEEARELLEAVNDLKPEEWHKFISEADGEKRLSLMEGALEKNPLNTDLRVELIREYRDAAGQYQYKRTKRGNMKGRRERALELIEEGLKLKLSGEERKELVHRIPSNKHEEVVGIQTAVEAQWALARENK